LASDSRRLRPARAQTAKFSSAKIRLPLIRTQRGSLGSILATLSIPLCFPANTLELFLEVLEVFIGEPFKINKLVSSPFNGTYDFVEFQINGFRVTVLRVLDEEHQRKVTMVVPVLIMSCQVLEK
jgi:hypothetical protein